MTAAIYEISEYRAKRQKAEKQEPKPTGVGFKLVDGDLVRFPLQTSQQEPG